MNKHYHLIGIGGIGMSGIAQLLLRKGAKVSGSDLKGSLITEVLKKSGAQIFIGHDARNIQGAQVLVYSSAIKEDNPEMREARGKGIPIFKRAQALAELMQDKTVITVAGSHGKTTTASLAAYLLLEAGLAPCVAVGGILKNIESNSCLGSGQFFVAEADESDGTFLCYSPRYSIVTNIDREHLDYYQEFDRELAAFQEFLHKTEEGGCLFCCADDVHLSRMLKAYKKKYVSFGLRKNAQIYPENIEFKGLSSTFDCFVHSKFIDRFELSLGGEHNISNALSVIALALELGIDLKFVKLALKNYQGAGRRLETRFFDSDVLVIDDYAHHPTEIKASLSACKHLRRKRIVAVFQPHRYSRTQFLMDEFGKSFDLADVVILTDIYAASESPIPGVEAKNLVDEIKRRTPLKPVVLLPKEQIADHVLGIMEPQDLIIFLGAGDIVKASESLCEKLNAARK